jgi:hypothetical protein
MSAPPIVVTGMFSRAVMKCCLVLMEWRFEFELGVVCPRGLPVCQRGPIRLALLYSFGPGFPLVN